MNTNTWHSEFSPAKFLSRVNLSQLIERNKAYNENITDNSQKPCIYCNKSIQKGIILNDKSFLCQECYSEIALISYPEKYENLRRQYEISNEARKIAKESFEARYAYAPSKNYWTPLALLSIPLIFFIYEAWILCALLFFCSYKKKSTDKEMVEEWRAKRAHWDFLHPESSKPELKHFHDPCADLTENDHRILKIFNHWPGYPPFWKYLRTVVLNRDDHRCQVTGCPSRLSLHIHHIIPVGKGGEHTPENLVTLCDFHHALEPDEGHERIWEDIKTRYFTLVCAHSRSNRNNEGTHQVHAHLRRLQLITLDDLRELTRMYGYCCPTCRETKLSFTLYSSKNVIRISCPSCLSSVEGPQQLAEETGPRLAEILETTRRKGKWKTRWGELAEKKCEVWGNWKSDRIQEKRKRDMERVQILKNAPVCPKCGSPMRLITPRSTDTWKSFWGCTQYHLTGCKGSARY